MKEIKSLDWTHSLWKIPQKEFNFLFDVCFIFRPELLCADDGDDGAGAGDTG